MTLGHLCVWDGGVDGGPNSKDVERGKRGVIRALFSMQPTCQMMQGGERGGGGRGKFGKVGKVQR